jgi:radical SAM-linked protein
MCEQADIILTRSIAPEILRKKLENAMPEGLDLLEIDRVHEASPKLSSASCISYMIELPLGETLDEAASMVRGFIEKESAQVERVRKNKQTMVDVKRFVLDAAVVSGADSDWLNVEVSMSERGSCSPTEVLQAVFGISANEAKCLRVVRTNIIFEETPTKR